MTKIIQRHDTSTNWTSINPILALGEMGVETDTNKFKFGDGVTTWSELAYSNAEIDLSDYYDKETTDALLDTKQDVLTAGTNITIENNVISATGGGGGGDLSNYYTKDETYSQEEVDTLLDEKEDVLNVVEPIRLIERDTISLTGYSYTSDNTAVYPETTTRFVTPSGSSNLSISIKQFGYTETEYTSSTLKSYVAIPYSLGQIVKVPIMPGDDPFVYFGKLSSDGKFYPIFSPIARGWASFVMATNDAYTVTNGDGSTADNTFTQITMTNTKQVGLTSSDYLTTTVDPSICEPGTALLQIYDLSTNMHSFEIWHQADATTGYWRVRRKFNESLITASDLERLREINCCMVASYYSGVSYSYPVDSFGLYNATGELGTVTPSLTENLFDITSNIQQKFVELKYDNQTIQVNSDGELVANLDELGNEVNAIAGRVTALENQSGGSSRNIGEIVYSTTPLTASGLHLLDGALINGSGIYSSFVSYIAGLVTDYPDLFETEANWQSSVTTYGVCGKFVYDSTANTVRLPKVTGIVEGTTDVTALGDLVQAGLPNITGTFNIGGTDASTATGAFYKTPTGIAGEGGGAGTDMTGHFDASLSNPIYGNSTSVQPQSVKVLYYIVLANSAKTEIEVDIDQVTTDLNGKADVDLSNCTKPYITETSDPSLWPSWYTVYSNGWCKQGGYLSGSTGTIVYLKQMSNSFYNITLTLLADSGEGQNVYASKVRTQTMTGFSWFINGATGYWRVEGYLYGTGSGTDQSPMGGKE